MSSETMKTRSIVVGATLLTWILIGLVGCIADSGEEGVGGSGSGVGGDTETAYGTCVARSTTDWDEGCYAGFGERVTLVNAEGEEGVFEFTDGVLTSAKGEACTYCNHPNADAEIPTVAEKGSCDQSYHCGGRLFRYGVTAEGKTATIGERSGHEYRQSEPLWYTDGCEPQCEDKACGSDRCGGVCGTCAAGEECKNISGYRCVSESGNSGNTSACDRCLDDCRGLSSCCRGVGCLCRDECSTTTTCPAGKVRCCGPDGDCFCWDDCPFN